MSKVVPASQATSGENVLTAMRYAALEPDDEAGLEQVWRQLHDELLADFPTQRRSAIRMSTWLAKDTGPLFEELLRDHDPGEFDELRAHVQELGLLAIVYVDVAVPH